MVRNLPRRAQQAALTRKLYLFITPNRAAKHAVVPAYALGTGCLIRSFRQYPGETPHESRTGMEQAGSGVTQAARA